MGVYITGDCHGEWQKLIYYSRCKNLTDKDFIIVCGDFGIWNDSDGYETMKLNMLSKIKPMVVFVDGNHENFDRLYSDEFETVDFCGGKAQKIRDNIYHLLDMMHWLVIIAIAFLVIPVDLVRKAVDKQR